MAIDIPRLSSPSEVPENEAEILKEIGDYNRDGLTNHDDVVAWDKAMQQIGDLNEDGHINNEDAAVWKEHVHDSILNGLPGMLRIFE